MGFSHIWHKCKVIYSCNEACTKDSSESVSNVLITSVVPFGYDTERFGPSTVEISAIQKLVVVVLEILPLAKICEGSYKLSSDVRCAYGIEVKNWSG